MYNQLTREDQRLIDAATDVIKRNYRKSRHTVGLAVLCESEQVYTGVNVDSCGYGPCAEPITIGTATSSGERVFRKIVAVDGNGNTMSPCGNCRQLLLDYAPDIEVILPHEGKVLKTTIKEVLPDAHSNFDQ